MTGQSSGLHIFPSRRAALVFCLLGCFWPVCQQTTRRQRLPLPQWGVTPHPRGSQKQLHQHDGCKAGQTEKADDAGRGRGDGDIEPGQGRE